MADLERAHQSLQRLPRPSILLGLATLAIHLAVNGGYGFFRDELYFIVCGQRLAWGYLDQPPLIPLIARITRALLGDSLLAQRMGPSLVMAVTVALTAELARVLGGGRFAQALAGGLCSLAATTERLRQSTCLDVRLVFPRGHNNYFLWGPMGHDGSVIIVLGVDEAELQKQYQDVTVAGYVDNPRRRSTMNDMSPLAAGPPARMLAACPLRLSSTSRRASQG